VVWTINDEETMKKLFEMGVDGVITDEPKKLFKIIS
jgi:glycerophosphoryl diester phosphodiesterase